MDEQRVREQAELAREIVAQHTGPWKNIEAYARKNPVLAVGAAILVGFIVARVMRLR